MRKNKKFAAAALTAACLAAGLTGTVFAQTARQSTRGDGAVGSNCAERHSDRGNADKLSRQVLFRFKRSGHGVAWQS
ncbi:MAG: hypothetical protein HFE84_09625 [Lachnospiraceae bacterium]|nr:hypothetical protein [Lachnospiraceae bacterium]